MIFKVAIKLTTPMLGNKLDHHGIRRFDRNANDVLHLEPEFWRWICDNVTDSLSMRDVDTTTILAPPDIHLPTVHLYRRGFELRSGRVTHEMHEAIKSGTVLRFQMMVTSVGPEPMDHTNLRSPNRLDLLSIFTTMGQFMGISPFGVKKGFGRFTVQSIEQQ